jgi:nicotinamide-nucleotide amidase
MPDGGTQDAVVRLAKDAGLTIATGESLTAGLLAARIADVPGASAVLRGGVVAYATDLKAALLGVPAELLAERGAVDPDVALAMAAGARERLRTDLGVATTGVAGPDPQDGVSPGTVFVAVAWPGGGRVRQLDVDGDRPAVRDVTVREALALLLETLRGLSNIH